MQTARGEGVILTGKGEVPQYNTAVLKLYCFIVSLTGYCIRFYEITMR